MVVAALVHAVGIKRMLKSGTQHHTRVFVKNIFSAIAVMHVEISYRHAYQTMLCKCMRSTDSDIIENAKSHRATPFCMMAGRKDVAEDANNFVVHNQIHTQYNGTGGA
jgi:hypothetical protein